MYLILCREELDRKKPTRNKMLYKIVKTSTIGKQNQTTHYKKNNCIMRHVKGLTFY